MNVLGWHWYRKDIELLYHTFLYSCITFFWYLSITSNAFIAYYIICNGIFINYLTKCLYNLLYSRCLLFG